MHPRGARRTRDVRRKAALVEFGWSTAEAEYRAAIREFVEAELAANKSNVGISGVASRRSVGRSFEFAAKLAERGWLTPHWPAEYGGSDATAWEHIILGEEMWSRGEPRGPQYMNVNWIGPAIMAAGTPEQKEYHLKRIAAGDVIWCQGFSEPDAGSDLASLNTTAIRDGDEYVVNGQKIWTSYANSAEYCFLLVRTDTQAEKHQGISILLTPTATPGLEIRDIRGIVGEHAFHHLYFTDMRVPVSCRLGPENEGWAVVRRALSYERVGSPRYARAAFMLDEIARWAHAHGKLTDPAVAERLVLAKARCEAARLLAYCVIDDRNKQRPPGPNAYVARVAMVQADRAVGELALDVMGSEGLAANSLADEQFRSALPAGVAAGTLEVQLNLVSRAVLGLPRS
jgi:alkylation response protein AidB-like acyl-CoA dehydrogenase